MKSYSDSITQRLVESQSNDCTPRVIGCIFTLFWLDVEYDLTMDAPSTRPQSHQWLWIASIWLGFGLFDATQTVFVMRSERMHHAWVHLFITMVLTWLPWALATPLVLRLGRRFPPVKLRPLSTWLIHLAACAAIGLVFTAWTTWLERLLNPYAISAASGPFAHVWLDKFYNWPLATALLYSTILVVNYALEYRERLALQQTETARLNEQLSKAQLNALRQQIEPHFLFNTLNAVSGLVREGRNDAAVSMIAGLSDFLRRVLEDSTRQQVPLEEEIEFAQKYLHIQKVRFAERLQISVDVAKELYPAQVPSLILQPMVENAVKHGIAKRAQGGAIRIAAARNNGTLTLSVCNDGPSLPVDWETTGSGIGISNVRTRLKSLYGEGFELRMRNQDTGGVEISVSLPFAVALPAVARPITET
jgi:two-component system, LytTR family, sensor kinase